MHGRMTALDEAAKVVVIDARLAEADESLQQVKGLLDAAKELLAEIRLALLASATAIVVLALSAPGVTHLAA